MKISSVNAMQVLDSRGNPTVRTFITLENGTSVSATVPSGASTGKYEALELRDGDDQKFLGQGVNNAVENVNQKISTLINGKEVENINEIDTLMLDADGTENKSNFGANAILSVSLAATRAAAISSGMPLWKFINTYYFEEIKPSFPRLMVNVINGGKHANWNFDIQEFMIVPVTNKPSDSVRVASDIFHLIGKVLKRNGKSLLVGDEGGFSPDLISNEAAFETIIEGAELKGYLNGMDYNLAIDAAASEFYDSGKYILKKDNTEISGTDLKDYYLRLKNKYDVISFEDPFDQDDWENFAALNENRDGYIVVGDDLTVTYPQRIQTGIERKAASGIIIKVNQVGSMKESVEAIKQARSDGWKIIISHRSGETEDSFIADLSFGSGADFIKTGSMSRSERLSKYNRLLEIELGM